MNWAEHGHLYTAVHCGRIHQEGAEKRECVAVAAGPTKGHAHREVGGAAWRGGSTGPWGVLEGIQPCQPTVTERGNRTW